MWKFTSSGICQWRRIGRFFVLAAAVTFIVPTYGQVIESIEINQAIGKLYNGAPNTSFVAGKTTVVRAFMTQAVTVDPITSSAVITRDGQNVTTLQPKAYSTPTRIVDFLCPSIAACGRWAAGNYEFEVTVNGGTTKSTAGTTYNFQIRRGLRILARPVKASFSGQVVSVPSDAWKSSWTYVRTVYPVAEDGITWVTRDEFDATNLPGVTIDMDTDDGRKALWDALAALQPATCATDPSQQGCFDLIVGFIGRNPSSKGTMLAGYTFTGPGDLSAVAVAVATDPDFAATVAHEIAHTRQLGDTYAGGSINCTLNPAPDGVSGTDFNTQSATTCNAGRMKASNIDGQYDVDGTLVPQTVNPYDVGGAGPLPNKADFMGAGSGQPTSSSWITPDSYVRLFAQLAPAPAQAQKAAAVRNFAAASIPAVEFSGSVTQSGMVTLQPWQSLVHDGPIPAITGPYSVRALDANGNTLATQGFKVSFFVLTNPPKTVTSAPFGGLIPFPGNTAKFQILKGAVVLKEVTVSATAPVISQVTPTQPSQTLTGSNVISWSAADADGNPLSFEVEYTPDITAVDSDWQLIASNLTNQSLTYDFSGLPGGKHAVIRVTASDGVRTASAMSTVFSVPYKAPEVFIDNDPNSNFELDDDIELSGSAVDLQDGPVTDEYLVWSSNISGKLGVGGDIVTTLPPGEHIITLTATNSAGMTSSTSVVIRVGSLAIGFSEQSEIESVLAVSNFGGLIASAELPAGVLSQPAAVTIEVTAAPANSVPPAGLAFAGRSFNLDVEQETSPDDFTPVTTIPQGVIITLTYDRPFDPSSLKLFRWDTASNSWVDAATECQPPSTYLRTGSRIITSVCRTGSFALAGIPASQGIILPANIRVGPGQQVEFPVSLMTPAGPNGVSIMLRTSDPSRVLFSPGPASSIDVVIPPGQTSPTRRGVYVSGIDFGPADITATASGLATVTQTVQVAATLEFSSQAVKIVSGDRPNRLLLTLSAPAGANGLVVNLWSGNPAVASVPPTAVIPANSTSVIVTVTPVSTGSTMIHASALPGVPDARTLVTVLPPQ